MGREYGKNDFMQFARNYRWMKLEREKLTQQKYLAEREKENLQTLNSQMQYVDSILDQIELGFGSDGRKMISDWLINHKTHGMIGKEMGCTAKHVQYETTKIMKRVFANENKNTNSRADDADIYCMAIPNAFSITAGV